MLVIEYLLYYFGIDIEQHVDLPYMYVLFWIRERSTCWFLNMFSIIRDSRMANMLIFYTVMYNFGFENGQHVDVLMLVVLFLDSEMVNMLVLKYLLCYLGIENGHDSDLL